MRFYGTLVVISASVFAACNTTPQYKKEEVLKPILAERIEVLEAFTRPRSFDDDPFPDGLDVVVRPLDPEGETTKLAGDMIFELYTYRQAAPDPKGQLVQTWQHTLADSGDQEMYWRRSSRTYLFPIRVNLQQLPPDQKYVILARHNNVWGEHMEDQAVIDLAELKAQIRAQIRQ